MRTYMYVIRDGVVDGRPRYVIKEYWREGGRELHTRRVVSLGTDADPAAALAAKKRQLAAKKRRLARLGPRQAKEEQRLDRSIARLCIDIAKIEMFLGGPRVLVIARDGPRLYQRTPPRPRPAAARDQL
jgi:hypothetical protein